jgi:hypothetical protein
VLTLASGKRINSLTIMEKCEISGHAGTGLIAWVLLGFVGLLAGNSTVQAESLWKFELKTPEPRTYWVEPSTDMLSPALKSPVTTLELRNGTSEPHGSIIDHRLILHLVEDVSVENFIKAVGTEVNQIAAFSWSACRSN